MTVLERKTLVEICRVELAKRPTEHDADPKRYEPPAWLLAALVAAYNAGKSDGHRAGAGLYPEGG